MSSSDSSVLWLRGRGKVFPNPFSAMQALTPWFLISSGNGEDQTHVGVSINHFAGLDKA
jgi:hypothetical protein